MDLEQQIQEKIKENKVKEIKPVCPVDPGEEGCISCQ